ncbi:MAG: hypothetical protein HY765_08215, partial [Rhodomicrobium sp.]|nr:hypothetical protein [Rhodomicrobium sp.]
MRRKVGKLGEKAFALLCAQAGFNAHPPDEDLFGWDYLVEGPVDLCSHGKLLDSAPAPVEFRVQVKSSDGSRGTEAISLDHMLRLAKLQMPVFFCFLAFDGDPQPVRAYLVHLGQELIALYEGLKKGVAAYVPAGMDAYVAWKNSILQSVGYGDPRVTAEVIFEVKDRSELLDLFLGVKESVGLKSVHALERRFGIGQTIGPSGRGPGVLSITDHPTSEGAILIRRDAYSPAITFPARWYFPPSAMNLPEDEVKLRLVSPTFEVLLWPHASRLRFHCTTINPDAQYPLQQLRNHAAAMHLLTGAAVPGCTIEFALRGKTVLIWTAEIPAGAGCWSKIAAVTDAALDVAQRAGVAADVQSSLAQLMRVRDVLQAIHGWANGASAKVQVDDPTCHSAGQ